MLDDLLFARSTKVNRLPRVDAIRLSRPSLNDRTSVSRKRRLFSVVPADGHSSEANRDEGTDGKQMGRRFESFIANSDVNRSKAMSFVNVAAL